ncbi:MAG: nucleoside hydrolase [Anaerolineaceae bacterium]|nr:nucleoside hydrolase [Anaerolineaceae bacterium]
MTAERPVLIDTDISLGTSNAEIDDGAALIVLLTSPEILCQGVSVVRGNVPVHLALQNAGRLLSFLGRTDIPLALGAGSPLICDHEHDRQWSEWQSAHYGDTPDWKTDIPSRDAANFIISKVQSEPGKLTILALGPFTNLALVLQKAPEIANQVREVIAMGGSFSQESSTPEFNIRCDPEAAQIVFNAPWPVRLLGLDITRRVLFRRSDFRKMNGAHPAVNLLMSQAEDWIKTVEEQGWEHAGCALHDAVAALVLLEPGFFEFKKAHIEVNTSFDPRRGITRISTKEDDNTWNKYVASSIDEEKCFNFIQTRLMNLEKQGSLNQ